jgi:hypothetical protein
MDTVRASPNLPRASKHAFAFYIQLDANKKVIAAKASYFAIGQKTGNGKPCPKDCP